MSLNLNTKHGVALTTQLCAVHMEFTATLTLVSVADIQTSSSEDNSQETSLGVNQHSSNTLSNTQGGAVQYVMS